MAEHNANLRLRSTPELSEGWPAAPRLMLSPDDMGSALALLPLEEALCLPSPIMISLAAALRMLLPSRPAQSKLFVILGSGV